MIDNFNHFQSLFQSFDFALNQNYFYIFATNLRHVDKDKKKDSNNQNSN